MKGIFCSVDWYSAIFTDCSVSDVLTWIGLDPVVWSDEFFVHQHERTVCFDENIVFMYENISVEVRQAFFYGHEIELSIFDKVVPRIRLNVSGQGLEFLRQQGIDVDTVLRDETKLMPGQHITRADFAFDFVNYHGELLDDLISYIDHNRTDSDRLCVVNYPSALRYSVRRGSEKTCYIGSPQSDKLLRIYDKKLQFTDPTGKIYIKEDPYEKPDSWIRIEWQLRNEWAHRICYALENKQYLAILKEIYKLYRFADLSTPAHRREAATFWDDLYNWQEISSIIQNKSFSKKPCTFYTRVMENVPRWMNHFLYALLALGKDQFEKMVNGWLLSMQHFDDSSSPLHNEKRWRNFISRLNELGVTSSFYCANSPVQFNSNGDLIFSFGGLKDE